MAKVYKLTAARLKELQDEMVWMKTVREKEVADLIKEARSFGDLSENSEYDEAKNEQGKLYSRMAEVDGPDSEPTPRSSMKVEVDARRRRDHPGSAREACSTCDELDAEEEYTIVGSQEANPMEGRISDDSPRSAAP